MAYDTSDTNLFVTDAYKTDAADISVSDDVDNTEQYSEEIVVTGWHDGITVDCKFIELSGTTQTDELYLNIYRIRNGVWVAGKQIVVAAIDCGNVGVSAGYKIKSITISAKASDPGHYKLGVVSSGSTNVFDVIIQGRYWG